MKQSSKSILHNRIRCACHAFRCQQGDWQHTDCCLDPKSGVTCVATWFKHKLQHDVSQNA